MWIAFVIIIVLFIIFLGLSFFMTYKNFTFEIDGGILKVRSITSHLKIYYNDKVIKDIFSPSLIKGEEIKVQIKEKEYIIRCKSNSLGFKMQVEIEFEGNIIADNGVKLEKNKQIKEK